MFDARSPLASEEKAILEYVREHPRSKIEEIYDGVGLDHGKGYDYLTYLLARGMIAYDVVENDNKAEWWLPHICRFYVTNPVGTTQKVASLPQTHSNS
jgi:hypothetical protein